MTSNEISVPKSDGIIQFIKFGIVGVLNTAVDWIVFFILTNFLISAKDSEPLAKAIAFIIALLNSYLWNTIWTFKKEYKAASGEDSSKKGGIFVKFIVVGLVGWAINFFAFKYTRFSLEQGQLISLAAASGSAIIWNFFANKLWTYKK